MGAELFKVDRQTEIQKNRETDSSFEDNSNFRNFWKQFSLPLWKVYRIGHIWVADRC